MIVSRVSLSLSLFVSSMHAAARSDVHIHTHIHTRRQTRRERCVSFALWARPLSLDRREAERSFAKPLGTGDCRLCFEEHALSDRRRYVLSATCDYRSDFQIGSAADRPIFSHVTHTIAGRCCPFLGTRFGEASPSRSAVGLTSSVFCLSFLLPFRWILLRSFQEDPRTDIITRPRA